MERHDAVNYIIAKYSYTNPDYLEIGVQYENTIKNVNSKNKDGVDPCIYGKNQYINYPMLSDDFFEKHISKKYDIIFIDGLHTAYQVCKDIYNSINNLKDGGVIVLDDVYPHNKNEQLSFKLSYMGPQTGDVWKTVYHVFDKLLEISDDVYFIDNTTRGNLIFKIKSNNTDNITVDTSYPTCNMDGACRCNNCEWHKYDYDRDFSKYLKLLNKYKIDI